MNRYILPHDLAGEKQRLGLMSELLDPLHRRHIEQLGLQAGWRCLEVGFGNGSTSEWLASRVAPSGHVVASDIDPRYIASLVVPNLQVRQLDILEDVVEEDAYDLVAFWQGWLEWSNPEGCTAVVWARKVTRLD